MSDVGSVREWASVAHEYEGNAKDQNIVRFFNKVVEVNQRDVDGVGRFKEVPYVEIYAPGQRKNSCVERRATDDDKERYPLQWAKFERKREQVDGTPLEEWPYLKRIQVETFKSDGFLTVESIAHAADSALAKLGMGALDLQKRARQFLKPQSDVETELRAEIVRLKDDVKSVSSERDHWKQVAESKPRRRKVRDEDDASDGMQDGA